MHTHCGDHPVLTEVVAGYFQALTLGKPLIPMLMGANIRYHQELQAILASTKTPLGPITSLFSPSPCGFQGRNSGCQAWQHFAGTRVDSKGQN